MAKLWVPMRCAHSGAEMVATFSREESAWHLTEAHLSGVGPNPSAVTRGIHVDGEFLIHTSYRGCPSCGLQSFFRCGCGGVTCFVGGESWFRCAWCGATGVASIGVFDVRASDRG